MRDIPAILFRTESYSGSGVRSIKDIIEYEMSELRNKDIPQYVLKNYGTYMSKSLWLDLKAILSVTGDAFPFFQDESGHGAADGDDLKEIVAGLINAVSCRVSGFTREKDTYTAHKTLQYGLWLADRREALDHYAPEEDREIKAYSTSEAVFSDLPDGTLFGYFEQPPLAPDPLRFELVCWPEDQFLMDDPDALIVDNRVFDSARLIPQDYIEGADGEEPVLSDPYYRIAWPYAQKAEEKFHELGMPVADLLHIIDSQDVFVSEKLLNKLITEDDSYEVGIFLQRNFLNPNPVGHEVIVNRIQPEVAIPEDAEDVLGYYYWGHYFELAGKRGYASNYSYGTNIRELEDGTTEDSFRNIPDENLHKKFWKACRSYGLPCGNITFNF